MDLLLKGLKWNSGAGDVLIRRSKIFAIGENVSPSRKDLVIQFQNHWLYPGLINSHDHLEMNLYPRLGHPPYGDYTKWGNDIYKPRQSPLVEIERVDIDDRLMWGGLKNLISGVTTVIHHNPRKKILSSDKFPVKVPREVAWSHSLGFGKDLAKKFPTNQRTPYVIHAAEGVTKLAFGEIQRLNELRLLQNNTVLVHGIGLSNGDIDVIKQSGAAIVWCPASNFYLYNETAPVRALKNAGVPIALGSDSTLTGCATLLEEMRFATDTQLASPNEILKMVTLDSAKIFNLPSPDLSVGAPADFFITTHAHPDYSENIQRIRSRDIMAVFADGKPKLCGEELANDLALRHVLIVDGVKKRLSTQMATILGRIQKKVGDTILSQNPLWKLVGI